VKHNKQREVILSDYDVGTGRARATMKSKCSEEVEQRWGYEGTEVG